MKQKYVIAHAHTNSEWDSVDFWLCPLEYLNIQRMRELNEFYHNECKPRDIWSFEDFTDIGEWFQWPTNDEGEVDLSKFPDGFEWDFDDPESGIPKIIEMDRGDIETFPRPQSHIGHGALVFNQYSVDYYANAKHTQDEFYADSLGLLLDQLTTEYATDNK